MIRERRIRGRSLRSGRRRSDCRGERVDTTIDYYSTSTFFCNRLVNSSAFLCSIITSSNSKYNSSSGMSPNLEDSRRKSEDSLDAY